MLEPKIPASIDDIHLDTQDFWTAPVEEREGAFALLRRDAPMSFHEEFDPPPEVPLPKGPGYWSVVRHADVLTASRRADLFCSGKGTSDPRSARGAERVLRLDDQHGRPPTCAGCGASCPGASLRRRWGCSKHDVERRATELIDAVIEKGECDFVHRDRGAAPARESSAT